MRVVDESAWVKGSNKAACLSAGTPIPVSTTSIRTRTRGPAGSADARTSTRPASVNLTAFATRLVTTCESLVGSPQSTCGRDGSQATVRSRPRLRAVSPSMVVTSSSRVSTSKSSRSSSNRPASIFEKSRMSLMMPSRVRLAPCTPVASRCCSGVSVVRSRRSLSPMTPLSGVRISWLIVARKSDFCREASMASSRACASCAWVRSRSATRASCSPTRAAICSMSSKRHRGGAEVITTTA